MASSNGSFTGSETTSQPPVLKAGSLSIGRRMLVVTTCSGVAGTGRNGSVSRLSRMRRLERSQTRIAIGSIRLPPNEAEESSSIGVQRQFPGVCAASRQSTGGGGNGTGAAAGGGALATGAGGCGAGFWGAAQEASKAVRTRRGAIAFTPLLWKEPRR